MKLPKSTATALALLAAASPCTAAQFFLKDRDKVVMMGDSITAQHLYSSYLEAWAITRFPAWDLRFVNVGIGGDGAPGGNNRFKRDVLPYAATAMTVDFGMNDAGGDLKNFMTSMQGIADQAKAANIRVAWCSPQACENPDDKLAIDTAGNRSLEKFTEGVKQTAVSNGNALFIDQFHPYLEFIDKARPTHPATRVGGGDQVHPGPPGQTLMAATILKGMSFPTLVAALEIDAASARVARNENCTVAGLKVSADGKITFNQKDNALPFFPDGDAKNILPWVPILEQMNDYRLKVTGLKASRYELRLAGLKVADCSSEELGAGVNLAAAVLTTGPIADQVKAVWAAIGAKNGYFNDRVFGGVVQAGGVPEFLGITPEAVEAKREAVFKARMAKMSELFDAIRKTLVMQAHLVEIAPVQTK
ncbi:MAG: GDSL-type esterase/lipase family protein [Verrucomicrobia bacterium]|nr:GDSL-type esterase/lipase family protein [Verrucomicrobiota bacterium]